MCLLEDNPGPLEILWGQVQATAVKYLSKVSHTNFFGFPLHIKVRIALYCCFLNMHTLIKRDGEIESKPMLLEKLVLVDMLNSALV